MAKTAVWTRSEVKITAFSEVPQLKKKKELIEKHFISRLGTFCPKPIQTGIVLTGLSMHFTSFKDAYE